jgi:HAD superfamily hydrolase (TIGR01509 family)
MAIKVVCFDLGGVIVEVFKESFAREIGPFSSFGQNGVSAMLTHNAPDNGLWETIDWFDCGRGPECSDYDFWLRMVPILQLDISRIDFFRFRKIYANFIRVMPEALDFVKRIKGQRLGVISNLCSIHQAVIHPEICNIFDFFVYSCVEKVRKPETLIYERARREAGVQYPEMLFLDDRDENLLAAAKLGMYTCPQYQERSVKVNIQIAEAFMRAHGILIS